MVVSYAIWWQANLDIVAVGAGAGGVGCRLRARAHFRGCGGGVARPNPCTAVFAGTYVQGWRKPGATRRCGPALREQAIKEAVHLVKKELLASRQAELARKLLTLRRSISIMTAAHASPLTSMTAPAATAAPVTRTAPAIAPKGMEFTSVLAMHGVFKTPSKPATGVAGALTKHVAPVPARNRDVATSTLDAGAAAEPAVLHGPQIGTKIESRIAGQVAAENAPPSGPIPTADAALAKSSVRPAVIPAVHASAADATRAAATQEAQLAVPMAALPVPAAAPALTKMAPGTDVPGAASASLTQPAPSPVVAQISVPQVPTAQPAPRTRDGVSAATAMASTTLAINAAATTGQAVTQMGAPDSGSMQGAAAMFAQAAAVAGNVAGPSQTGAPDEAANLDLPHDTAPREVLSPVMADQNPGQPASTAARRPVDQLSRARLPPVVGLPHQSDSENSTSAPVDRATGRRPAAAVPAASAASPANGSGNLASSFDTEQVSNAAAKATSDATLVPQPADPARGQAGGADGDSKAVRLAGMPDTPAAPASGAPDAATPNAGSQSATQPRAPGVARGAAAADGSDIQPASTAAPDPGPDAPPPVNAAPPAAAPYATAPSQPAGSTSLAAASQVAHAVAGVHVAAGGQGQITIHLQPGDLGAVQVKIERGADGSSTVTVQVEKADTLQIMQQDISHLHQALDRAGVPSDQRQVTLHLASPATDSSVGAGTDSGSGFQRGGQSQPQAQPQSQSQQQQTRNMVAAPQDDDTQDDTGARRWMPVGINITA